MDDDPSQKDQVFTVMKKANIIPFRRPVLPIVAYVTKMKKEMY